MSKQEIVAVVEGVFAQWRRDGRLSGHSLAELALLRGAGFRWELRSREKALLVSRVEAVGQAVSEIQAAA